MEQAPIRLAYVAAIVAASLVIFTGSLSYGIGARNRLGGAGAQQQVKTAAAAGRTAAAGPGTARPAPTPTPAPAAQQGPVAKPAAAGAKQAGGAQPGPQSADPPRRHMVAQGETLWELAARYGVDMEDLLAANKGIDAGEMQIGQELVIPPKTGSVLATSSALGEESVAAYAGLFTWPVVAPVSSPFGPRWGRMHSGVDLAANMGEPIRASRDGEVLIAGTVPGYGNTVVLQHSDRTRTLYAHASRLLVRSGQKVGRGEVIALVGSTGHSTGPHLHFEIIVNNRPRDPLPFMPRH